jgi:hypothetical protein
LEVDKGIAMRAVETGASLDVDGAAGRATRFSRKAVVDNLEVADGFWRKLRTAASSELVVIGYAVDVDCVTAGTQTSKAKAAARLGESLL